MAQAIFHGLLVEGMAKLLHMLSGMMVDWLWFVDISSLMYLQFMVVKIKLG
jgi:hypothetical protein